MWIFWPRTVREMTANLNIRIIFFFVWSLAALVAALKPNIIWAIMLAVFWLLTSLGLWLNWKPARELAARHGSKHSAYETLAMMSYWYAPSDISDAFKRDLDQTRTRLRVQNILTPVVAIALIVTLVYVFVTPEQWKKSGLVRQKPDPTKTFEAPPLLNTPLPPFPN